MKLKFVIGLVGFFLATQAYAAPVPAPSLDDVTLDGQSADQMSDQVKTNGNKGSLIDPANISAAFGGEAFTDLGQAGFTNVKDQVSGILFSVTVNGNGTTSGTWDLTWSGNVTPVTADFVVLLKAGNGYVAYFFDDVALAAGGGSYTLNSWQIGFPNGGGQAGGLSTMEIYVGGVGDPPPSTVPEPATMLLFGTGLLGLAGLSRRKN
ncbi:MAG: PEP-CTERM sorting domain-containing protein [Desulfobulbus sp.]|nr:PEP-CTERM sorting domain-containing protein [Desulfobulbus sp.]